MVVKRRILAPIAFAWTLAAAGMAAVALTASPGDNALPGLQDIQIGERGNQTRIVLICEQPCAVEKRGNREFFIRGVDASLTMDISARSEKVKAVSAELADGGSILHIETAGAIEYANTKNCTIAGRAAACIDLFFEDAADEVTQAPAAVEPTIVAEKPALREASPERMAVFARLTPPERLSPPAGAFLAKVQPIEAPVEVRKPAIRFEEPLPAAAGIDFAGRIKALLSKDLSTDYCNTAEATLQEDAWALSAMVDVGLCAAARGDVVEADATLARLLEYTPDNYEALVGRALIATQANEKSVARKYYQDALNALPPIEESNKIVDAMAAL